MTHRHEEWRVRGDEPVEVVDVAGGASGLEVQRSAARQLARQYDEAGDRLRGWAALGAAALADPDLLASAMLSPLTFAEAEAFVLAATTGPDGLLPASLGWEFDADAIRAWLTAVEGADAAVEGFWDVADYLLGRTIGTAVAALGPALALSHGPALLLAWSQLPDDTRRWLTGELEEFVVDHPDLVQHVANGGGGLVDGLLSTTPGWVKWAAGIPLLNPTGAAGASVLAHCYGPEPGVTVTPTWSPARTDRGEPARQPAPPHGFADLWRQLEQVPHGGTIRVLTMTDEHGVLRHIVYLPGTEAWTLPGQESDGSVRDLLTNLLLGSDEDHDLAHGIQRAMAQAGVEPDDPVLLVGHSQGGIEALHLAAHAGDYAITHVVTAGSAESMTALPDDVQALSVQQRGDVVPQLDGAGPPESPNHATVTVDNHPAPGILGAHDLDNYIDAAEELEGAGHPEVDQAIAQLDPFLAADTSVVRDFTIVREEE